MMKPVGPPDISDPSSGQVDSRGRERAIATVRASGLIGGIANPVLDRLSGLAARLLGAPVALVSLVDDQRQHFPGMSGLGGWAGAQRGTPLSHSFCRRVAASGAPLIIDDALSHPTLSAEPAVTDLGIVAYLGVPLTTPGGETLGAFCVIDHEPRQWTETDRTILADLAIAACSEIALRDLDARFRLVVEATQEVIYTQDYLTGEVTRQGAVQAVYGCSEQELEETTAAWLARVDPHDRERVAASWSAAVVRGTGSWLCEYRMRHDDGRVVVVQDRARIVADAAGIPQRIAGAVTDITEQRVAQEALQSSEEQWRRLLESAYEGICTVDETGMITYANPRLGEMLGYPHHELAGESFFNLMDPESSFDARTRFARRQRGIAETQEMSIRRKDGRTIWVRNSASSFFAPEGRFAGALFFLSDVTERREAEAERTRAEQALRDSEERYALAARATQHAIWDWNLLIDTIAWSDRSLAVFGYERSEIVTDFAWWYEAIRPDQRDRVVRSIHAVIDGADRDHEWRDSYQFRRADGSYASVIDRGYVVRDEGGRAVRMIGAMEDVTTQRHIEEQLRQAQKMEAVGQLAGGVAHDFNNLLTVISGNLEFVQGDLPQGLDPEHPVHADLEEIRRAAEHARTLVRQLLTFCRKQPVRLQLLRVRNVLREAEKLLRRLIGEEIAFVVEFDDSDVMVRADPGQLEQVLMNLAVNARDAMLTPLHGHPGTGGTLTISAAAVSLSEGDARVWDVIRPGGYVSIRVQDTGHGMDAETHAHAFEPFYTTKGVGSGTGLGLATVFGIVRQAGGAIRIESAPGQGTAFTILLPAADAAADDRLSEDAPPQSGLDAHATILLVEDETPVRATLGRMLARRGYAVLEACDGAHALTVWREHRDRIDAVVTDLRMPELGGRELVRILRAESPALPVVYVSGYSERGEGAEGGASEAFVEKPFSVDALLCAVHQVLGGVDRQPQD